MLHVLEEVKEGPREQPSMSKPPTPDDVTLVWRWIVTLNQLFRITQTGLAEKAGLSQSTISKLRCGRNPLLDTMQRLWHTYLLLARERRLTGLLSGIYEESFFASAWHMTERQRQLAEGCLASLSALAPSLQGEGPPDEIQQQIAIRLAKIEELRETITELHKEMELLNRQQRNRPLG